LHDRSFRLLRTSQGPLGRRRESPEGSRRQHDRKGRRGLARALEGFEHVAIAAPAIDVDTTDAYDPPLEEIVEFVNR